GPEARLLERAGDGHLGADAGGVEPAAGHRVAAGAAPEDLAADPRPPRPRVLALLEDQDPRPLRRHPAVATPVEGPARLARLALPLRHRLEQPHPDQAQGMDLGIGPPRD